MIFSRWAIVQPGPADATGLAAPSPRRLRRARLALARGRGARVAPGAWRCRRWLHPQAGWPLVGAYQVGIARDRSRWLWTSEGRAWQPGWLRRARRVLRAAA